jgi:NAD(P)-dependent dehydrogenase (short-subunit alcohol dehydrogenase family)
MLAVNLTSAYLCCREVIEVMAARHYGRIVNVASTAALTGSAYISAYCAAKHGVLGLTRALAVELARSGITVNAVCPGYTETDMLTESIEKIIRKTGRSAEAVRAELLKSNPQGRFVTVDEVAGSVLWLCLPGSQSVTGQAIAIDGGEVL